MTRLLQLDGARVLAQLREARRRILAWFQLLTPEQWLGPKLAIVNPPLWEIGHVGWFQERWMLRQRTGRAPLFSDSDRLFDSSDVPHPTRWELPLRSRDEVLRYLDQVLEIVAEELTARAIDATTAYFANLVLFHEDMHTEAAAYTHQTHGWPAPAELSEAIAVPLDPLWSGGDALIPGGRFRMGSRADGSFVFDNEKWSHWVTLRPFRIARAPVTQGEFLQFVAADGYRRREWWSVEGLAWRESVGADRPAYWRDDGNGRWSRRCFERWRALEPDLPMLHVNCFEAEAYCRFAQRRLPREAEWEAAAACTVAASGDLGGDELRAHPWGDEPAGERHAHLDGRALTCASVAGYPGGDSAFGCRQMLGNVWEWTADAFRPYPGFSPDPYRDYSEPWFGTHRVLRGGCLMTRSRLIRNAYRNFYTPDRRDVWAGFRTAADES